MRVHAQLRGKQGVKGPLCAEHVPIVYIIFVHRNNDRTVLISKVVWSPWQQSGCPDFSVWGEVCSTVYYTTQTQVSYVSGTESFSENRRSLFGFPTQLNLSQKINILSCNLSLVRALEYDWRASGYDAWERKAEYFAPTGGAVDGVPRSHCYRIDKH